MKTWIELEESFLSDNRIGTDDEPTTYYLFVRHCTEDKRGRVRRRRAVETLKGKDSEDLDAQLLKFTERPDVARVEEAKEVRRPCPSCSGFDESQRRLCRRCLGRGYVNQ